jgi:hypothetical protein
MPRRRAAARTAADSVAVLRRQAAALEGQARDAERGAGDNERTASAYRRRLLTRRGPSPASVNADSVDYERVAIRFEAAAEKQRVAAAGLQAQAEARARAADALAARATAGPR